MENEVYYIHQEVLIGGGLKKELMKGLKRVLYIFLQKELQDISNMKMK